MADAVPYTPRPPDDDESLTSRKLMACLRIAFRNPDSPEGDRLARVVFVRFAPYLTKVVSRHLGSLADRDGIRDVVNDAVCIFFRRLDRFDDTKCPADEIGYDRALRAYLGRCAQWRAQRARRFEASIGRDAMDPGEFDLRVDEPNQKETDSDPAPSSTRGQYRERMTAVLNACSPLERDVISLYFLDDHPGRKSDRLPKHVAQTVATRHGTTVENLRQIKHSLKKKIVAHFPELEPIR